MTTSIDIAYKMADGWHVFTSEQLPGLYVASPDAETAYNDVGPALEMLLKLDEGIVCKAKPELSFEEFVQETRGENYVRPTLVLTEQRYSLSCQ